VSGFRSITMWALLNRSGRMDSCLQDEDDRVDNVNDSLVYYLAPKNAGVRFLPRLQSIPFTEGARPLLSAKSNSRLNGHARASLI